MPYAALVAAAMLVAPASAQSDARSAALDAFLRSGAAPRLAAFLTQTGGKDAFAAGAADDAAVRESDWRSCEAMLSGGRRDADGAALRAALAKLPAGQLYFAARLFAATKSLRAELGGGRWGNVKENLGLCSGRLCYERANTLQQRMEDLRARYYQHWDGASVDASPGEFDEHTAACYSFYPGSRGGGSTVELIADAWDDSFTTAETWFAVHDPAAHQALAAAGKDWCGPSLAAIRRPQRDRLVEEENRADERKARLRDFGEKLSRGSVLGL